MGQQCCLRPLLHNFNDPYALHPNNPTTNLETQLCGVQRVFVAACRLLQSYYTGYSGHYYGLLKKVIAIVRVMRVIRVSRVAKMIVSLEL